MPCIHHQGTHVSRACPSSQRAIPPLGRICIMTHDDVWHALPFFANGTLRDQALADVEAHLAVCPECRAELVAQTQVRDTILREDVPQESAQSGFDHLWGRIQEDEAIAEAHAARPSETNGAAVAQRPPAA